MTVGATRLPLLVTCSSTASPVRRAATTAPAAIYEKGLFHGQQSSFWVNPGQETSLRINKALSLRALNSEHETEGSREVVYIGRNDYHKTLVQGAVKVTNHRGVKVRMVIRRRFSGELMEADGSPKASLLEEGVYSLNPRRELVWDLVLEAGKEIELCYKYSVLVDR